jgi:hypothetical protein
MLTRTDAVSGLMITGSPPVAKGAEELGRGFLPSEHMGLAGQEEFSEAEVDAYARATCGINAPFEPFLKEAVARTDGCARALMFASFSRGEGCDQQQAAIHSAVPLAIVNGGGEPFVNNAFVQSLTYDNLWEDKVYLIDGVGHAPFWEAPREMPLMMKTVRASHHSVLPCGTDRRRIARKTCNGPHISTCGMARTRENPPLTSTNTVLTASAPAPSTAIQNPVAVSRK